MVIANPIYDVVFKRLMENDRVAKFFIGTLLNETVESVELKPQEFTYIKNLDKDDPDVQQYIRQQLKERLSINVLRLDFVATIKTSEGGNKKVLIEIQKAQRQTDLLRFRNYLAEQYKKLDTVEGKKMPLPITTIYILGFELPEIKSSCIKVERQYIDLIQNTVIPAKSDFVEQLTHDSYVVQVERITDRYQTRLDKLLSVFEQRYFIDDSKVVKEYKYNADLEDVKLITDILHHSGTNPKERKELDIEAEAWRTINALLDDERESMKKELEESKKALNEKDRALDEKDKLNQELLQQLEEMKRQLGARK